MKRPENEIKRRDFNQLTMAALAGVVTGTLAGCGDGGDVTPGPASEGSGDDAHPEGSQTKPNGDESSEVSVNDWMGEKHVCRGLNKCKGLGASGENDCAGQGTCATYAHHECGGHNDCKFQGGCGAEPAQNSCKGEGKCHVPLMDKAWEHARESFEEAMKTASKEFGDAPEKAAS